MTYPPAALAASPGALFCLAVFALAYYAVLGEEIIRLRKSKPMTLAAGVIWFTVALVAPRYGISHEVVARAADRALDDYAALLLFLVASIAFITAIRERGVFDMMRQSLVRHGYDTRAVFWLTGLLAFLLSVFANNLTTALVVGAVIMAVDGGNRRFVVLSCVNAVNAANAGGVISPFGDITTLMVWQSGHVAFFQFFRLCLPALASFLIPAVIMGFFVPREKPAAAARAASLKPGAGAIVFLGLFSIVLTVGFQHFLGLPPYLGMMTGMALLMMLSWFISESGRDNEFDVMRLMAAIEWDTLLFFFGVMFSIAGLAFLGYVDLAARGLYRGGESMGNIGLGLVSAVVDNIPIMFAALNMHHDMSLPQWLLLTLTTGIGGSLLSIGSAAGVALMGVARGQYTFASHLKWTPVLLLGYFGAIAVHFWLNG